jgi:hypothetical protein
MLLETVSLLLRERIVTLNIRDSGKFKPKNLQKMRGIGCMIKTAKQIKTPKKESGLRHS